MDRAHRIVGVAALIVASAGLYFAVGHLRSHTATPQAPQTTSANSPELQISIPKGMRAMSVRLSDSPPLAENPRPWPILYGDVFDSGRLLLAHTRIVAANRIASKDPEGQPFSYMVATFFVTPEQAEQLTRAASEATIQLALDTRPVRGSAR